MASVADDFPMQLWDHLPPQVDITVNPLWQSNTTPKVLACAYMSGPFDYNKIPLAPTGCKVQVPKKIDKRGTWVFHSVNSWYVATSPGHYCTDNCHIKDTQSNRFSDTVQFQHKDITNLTITPHDKIMHALADCAKAIKGINKSTPHKTYVTYNASHNSMIQTMSIRMISSRSLQFRGWSQLQEWTSNLWHQPCRSQDQWPKKC